MKRGADNYYLILELDFLKPESDMAVIDKRIADKVKFWNANSERGKKAAKYRQYKLQLIDIKKVMKTEAARQAEAKEALEYVQPILKEQLKFFASQKGSADKKEIEKASANVIMEKCSLWDEMFEKMTGLKIVDKVETAKSAEDPNPKPEFHSKFKGSETPLDIMKRQNLYDFLADSEDADIIAMQSLSGEDLINSYANPLKERYKNDRTDIGTSVRSLCSLSEEIFTGKDKSMRGNYDKFLIWQKKDDVINRMVKYSGTNKSLDEQQSKLFVDELTQIERNREQAQKTFQQICAFKEIWASGGGGDSKNQIACGHCYAMVDISHGERKCSSCGSDLYIKCPSCQKEVPASSVACGYCGFKLDDVQKVEQLCVFARQSITNMDFIKARNHLESASRLLKTYSKIAEVRQELEKQEKIFSAEVEKLNALVAKKAYYKAADVLKSLQKKAPTARIANDVLVESAVAEAERLYKQAVAKASENDLIKLCSQISSVCPDYPGVDALVLKYPPQPPTQLRFEMDASAGSNTLTWHASPSQGEISYKVIRKEHTAAASVDDPDAEELGIAGTPRFVDTKPKAGIEYYYSIYTMRAGVPSSPAIVSGCNLSEVSVLSKEEGDGYVKAAWKPLEKNVEIEVWRCLGKAPAKRGEGTKITVGNGSFTDYEVENDQTYGYLVLANYHVSGKRISTQGVSFTLTPTSVPDPVDDLSVKNVEDEVFLATWSYEGSEKVMLYYTDQRVRLQFGDIVELQKVTDKLTPVDVVSSSKNSCRFRIKDDKKYSIFPVTIKHNTAVIGEQAIAARMERIKVTSTELVNSELMVNIDWPKDAVSILVLYGNNGYAKDIEDRKGRTARSISKKQFESDGALKLSNIEKQDYYITLYSACRLNGELAYSDGTQLLFSNCPKMDIQYSIRVKGLFSKQIEVEFKCEAHTFSLPDIDIVTKQHGTPVYANSGRVVEHIEAQTVEGSLRIALDAKSLPKDSYLKAFFTDDDMNDSISLRAVYGTNFKVS